ncbi:unnamed protein product [Amoebophrya sp. A120]|nr:unnamed protein product [Amoebophrya sp. A120]|eukprot:GSA120T00011025001.1
MRIFFLHPGQTVPDDATNPLTDLGREEIARVIGHLCDVDYYKKCSNFTSNTSPTTSSPQEQYKLTAAANFYAPPGDETHVLVIYHGPGIASRETAEAVQERCLREGSFADAVCLQLLDADPGTEAAALTAAQKDWWADLLRTKPAKERKPRSDDALASPGGSPIRMLSKSTPVPTAVGPLVEMKGEGGVQSPSMSAQVSVKSKSGAAASASKKSASEKSKAGGGGEIAEQPAEGVETAAQADEKKEGADDVEVAPGEDDDGAKDKEQAKEEAGGTADAANAEQEPEAAAEKPEAAEGDEAASKKSARTNQSQNKSAAGGSSAKQAASAPDQSNTKAAPPSTSAKNKASTSPASKKEDGVSSHADPPVASNAATSVLSATDLMNLQTNFPPKSPSRRPKVDPEILSRIGSAKFSVLFVVEEPVLRRMVADLIHHSKSEEIPTDFGGDPRVLLQFLKLRPATLLGLETPSYQEQELPKWVLLGEKSLLEFHWEISFLLTPDLVY